MIEIKVVRNVILNNIDLHDQPSRMHLSPPRSCQKFSNSKNSKITVIFNETVHCFGRNKSCPKLRYKQLLTSCSTLQDRQFSLQQSLKLVKFSHFAEKIVFWSNLEAPSEKTMHIQELVMIFKVVLNNIIDITHFDQNTVRSNLKELCKI